MDSEPERVQTEIKRLEREILRVRKRMRQTERWAFLFFGLTGITALLMYSNFARFQGIGMIDLVGLAIAAFFILGIIMYLASQWYRRQISNKAHAIAWYEMKELRREQEWI